MQGQHQRHSQQGGGESISAKEPLVVPRVGTSLSAAVCAWLISPSLLEIWGKHRPASNSRSLQGLDITKLSSDGALSPVPPQLPHDLMRRIKGLSKLLTGASHVVD